MRERYQKLYHLPRRLYASGAPVLIEAGSLLLEQASGALLCQLCFRSIQDRPIKALRAAVQPLDDVGRPLGKPVDHRYLDLALGREEEFGRDTAILLPAGQAAAFTARVSQVSFADGEVWTDEGLAWEELPQQPALEEFCGGEAQADRFRRRFGQDLRLAPLEAGELWFCACGAVNPIDKGRCHRCRCRRSALLGRNAAHPSAEEREEARFHAPQPGGTARRRRALLLGAGAVVLLGLLAILLLPRLGETAAPTAPESPAPADARRDAYEAALALLDAGELDDAEDAFRALGDYEDSADYLSLVIPYRRALVLQDMADYAPLEDAPRLYEQAAAAFEALGDYEDCAKRAVQCREDLADQLLTLAQSDYEDAAALLESGRYADARAAFLALGDHEDSADLAREAVYRKALALYEFAAAHSVRGVTAALTLEPGRENLVALPREQLLTLGEEGLRELAAAFGGDPVRFVAPDSQAEAMPPLEEAVAQLLRPLGDYRNSAELAALLPELIDRSDEFFALCQAGELEAARDWLNAYTGPFEGREQWLARLDEYLPLCRGWTLYSGDPSLVSQIAGEGEHCYTLQCRVILREDGAVLRFLLREGDTEGPELFAEPGESRFLLYEGKYVYLAQRNASGSLSIIKLQDGDIIGGAEYTPGD